MGYSRTKVAIGSQVLVEDSVEALNGEILGSEQNIVTKHLNFKHLNELVKLTLLSINLRIPGNIMKPLRIPNANTLPEIIAILFKFNFKFIIAENV